MNRKYRKNTLWRIHNREMKSLLSLLGLIGLVIIIPLIAEKLYFNSPLSDDTRWIKELKSDTMNGFSLNDTLNSSWNINQKGPISEKNKVELMGFDPNTASDETWKKFHLADFKIRMIKKYLKKGGRFYKPDDLSRMYCLNEDEIQQMRPYIKIIKGPERAYYNGISKKFMNTMGFSKKGPYHGSKISLNSGAYEDFKELGCLNSHEIFEILNFRRRNGAFSDIRELKNLKIIDLSTYNRIEKSLTLN